MQDSNLREIIKTILTENGILVLENPKKFQTIFLTMSDGQFKKECNGLIQSIEEKIPLHMNNGNNNVPYEIYAPKYCKILQEKYGLNEDLAIWTIELWALTFGIPYERTVLSSSILPEKTNESETFDELRSLDEEYEVLAQSKKLWETGQLPWSWWSTCGMKWEYELKKKRIILLTSTVKYESTNHWDRCGIFAKLIR